MKFILLGNPRSGSTALMHLFGHNGLKCLCEPFNKKGKNWIKDYHDIKIIRRGGTRDFIAFFDAIENRYDMYKHLLYSAKPSKNKLMVERFRTIFIYRKNIFESSLSNQIAKYTRVWNCKDIKEDYNNLEITLDKKIFWRQCRYYVQKNQQLIDLYNKYDKRSLLLSYENLYHYKTDEMINRVREFTGLALPNLYHLEAQNKMNKLESYNRVTNLKELQTEFKEYGELIHVY